MSIRKNLLKRFLAFSLGIITSLSALTTAYAVEFGGDVNSGSSGSERAGSWAEYAHRFFAYPQNQGIRMYLVKEDGKL